MSTFQQRLESCSETSNTLEDHEEEGDSVRHIDHLPGDDQDKHDPARGEDPDHAHVEQEDVQLGNIVSGVHVHQHQQLGQQKHHWMEQTDLELPLWRILNQLDCFTDGGDSVLTVASAVQAPAGADTGRPAVVTTDLEMPKDTRKLDRDTRYFSVLEFCRSKVNRTAVEGDSCLFTSIIRGVVSCEDH